MSSQKPSANTGNAASDAPRNNERMSEGAEKRSDKRTAINIAMPPRYGMGRRWIFKASPSAISTKPKRRAAFSNTRAHTKEMARERKKSVHISRYRIQVDARALLVVHRCAFCKTKPLLLIPSNSSLQLLSDKNAEYLHFSRLHLAKELGEHFPCHSPALEISRDRHGEQLRLWQIVCAPRI